MRMLAAYIVGISLALVVAFTTAHYVSAAMNSAAATFQEAIHG